MLFYCAFFKFLISCFYIEDKTSYFSHSLFSWTRKLQSLSLWLPGSPVMMVITTFRQKPHIHCVYRDWLKNVYCSYIAPPLTLSAWPTRGFLSSAEGKSTPRWSYRMGSGPMLLRAKCWRNLRKVRNVDTNYWQVFSDHSFVLFCQVRWSALIKTVDQEGEA